MIKSLVPNTALIVIDMQKAIDDPSWGTRNHPDAESKGAEILAAWRAAGRPIYHVRHDSLHPNSTYKPGQALHEFKPEFVPQPDEPVVPKHTGSAFVGTDLEDKLATGRHEVVVVFGVITNNSVESTVRHGACLGYHMILVEDACFTFGRKDFHGITRTADEVHAMSLANLEKEYCEIVTSTELLQMI